MQAAAAAAASGAVHLLNDCTSSWRSQHTLQELAQHSNHCQCNPRLAGAGWQHQRFACHSSRSCLVCTSTSRRGLPPPGQFTAYAADSRIRLQKAKRVGRFASPSKLAKSLRRSAGVEQSPSAACNQRLISLDYYLDRFVLRIWTLSKAGEGVLARQRRL